MADPFVTKLNKISKAGTPAKTFLTLLGPIHNNWHVLNNSSTESIGFLLFHWELIQRFNSVGGPAFFGGVTPFSTVELSSFGSPYDVAVTVHSANVGNLEQFSTDMEAWHDNAHMAVGMAFHIDMMKPKTNVRRVQFWRLHYFINDRFEEKLAQFSPGSATQAVITQLEASPQVKSI